MICTRYLRDLARDFRLSGAHATAEDFNRCARTIDNIRTDRDALRRERDGAVTLEKQTRAQLDLVRKERDRVRAALTRVAERCSVLHDECNAARDERDALLRERDNERAAYTKMRDDRDEWRNLQMVAQGKLNDEIRKRIQFTQALGALTS